MSQMTWRTTDALLERVRAVAASRGMSLNHFVTEVLDAATNPELARTDLAWVTERLAHAGLLAVSGLPRAHPDAAEFAAARKAAGRGGPLGSDIVATDRG